MKYTLMKERGEGRDMKRKHEATRDMKRKHEATLLEFERLQEAYQVLESENEDLVLSNTIAEGEKKDFENKILELVAQNATIDRQA